MLIAQVNEIDLFYEDSGAGTDADAPLLLHHGHSASHWTWEGLVERLRERFRCITVDARGSGESGKPAEGYGLEQYASDVLGLANHLSLERFTFVGHSLGGTVGYFLAVHHAERLETLVLIAPAPADGGAIPEEVRRARLDPWFAKDREALIQRRLLGSPRPPSLEEAALATERELVVSEGHMVESLDALEQSRLGDRLEAVQTPTLMVAGAADPFLPYNLADFARLGNATLHVFSRVGHGIPSEVPSALARVIPDFLEHGVVTAETLAERALALQAAKRD